MTKASVQVYCRLKPSEKQFKSRNIRHDKKEGVIKVNFSDNDQNGKEKQSPRSRPGQSFEFSKVLGIEMNQKDVFASIQDSVTICLKEFQNLTVLSYGQTGSGKTYTLFGKENSEASHQGLAPRVLKSLFKDKKVSEVKLSFFEIHLEKIKDLLFPQEDNLQLKMKNENENHINGLTTKSCFSHEEAIDVTRFGLSNRTTASTNLNSSSSRSHAVLQLTVTHADFDLTFNLVDLAGSENILKSGALGLNKEEAISINKSLSALGNVVRALTNGKTNFIPYRNSKLTRVLKESIGGNSRTVLILNISTDDWNLNESINTLKFGALAKKVVNVTTSRKRSKFSIKDMEKLLKSAEKAIHSQAKYIKKLEKKSKATPQENSNLESLTETVRKLTERCKSLKIENEQLISENEKFRSVLSVPSEDEEKVEQKKKKRFLRGRKYFILSFMFSLVIIKKFL